MPTVPLLVEEQGEEPGPEHTVRVGGWLYVRYRKGRGVAWNLALVVAIVAGDNAWTRIIVSRGIEQPTEGDKERIVCTDRFTAEEVGCIESAVTEGESGGRVHTHNGAGDALSLDRNYILLIKKARLAVSLRKSCIVHGTAS